jgi:hypothetical protein
MQQRGNGEAFSRHWQSCTLRFETCAQWRTTNNSKLFILRANNHGKPLHRRASVDCFMLLAEFGLYPSSDRRDPCSRTMVRSTQRKNRWNNPLASWRQIRLQDRCCQQHANQTIRKETLTTWNSSIAIRLARQSPPINTENSGLSKTPAENGIKPRDLKAFSASEVAPTGHVPYFISSAVRTSGSLTSTHLENPLSSLRLYSRTALARLPVWCSRSPLQEPLT